VSIISFLNRILLFTAAFARFAEASRSKTVGDLKAWFEKPIRSKIDRKHSVKRFLLKNYEREEKIRK
jgi:hypothetical protein